ncbi:unnamed protein product [Moneuplotes crassus]|uniref:Uncharacterized protein n=1 Tax=Euplotes crassus TaxID=5936 RepID=A0AAD1XEP7_EUPCR|nr:unnamed protein product [Moneuplotes crassus]
MNIRTAEEERKDERGYLEEPGVYLDHKYYIYALIVPILFGTRAITLEKTLADPYWIFCIENMFVLVICLGLTLSLYFYIGCSRISFIDFCFKYVTIFKIKRVVLLAIISGFCLAAGNFLLILAFNFNDMSQGSSTPLSCVLLVSTLICLWFGIYFFNERHAYRQYLGGAIMLAAAVLLTTERDFEVAIVVSIYKNAYFIISLVLGLISCFFVSCAVICGKFAMFHHNANPVEFGVLSMTFASIISLATLVKVILSSEEFITDPKTSGFFTVIRIGFQALLYCVGYIIFYKAANLGTIGSTQLFYNCKIAVVLIEEFLIVGIIPGVTRSSNLVFELICFVALFVGAFLLVFVKEKKRTIEDLYEELAAEERDKKEEEERNKVCI